MDESDEAVAQIRRFNRVVTQRIGVLDDQYLARDRPLGEARVLWEIGAGRGEGDEGCDLRVLRARLGLDSGYLSRLLRSLESAGLVRVAPGDTDRRVRTARLTRAGVRERATLDERSEALALSLLAPLRDGQRQRLIEAMADVEQLLTASLVAVGLVDPGHVHVQHCLDRYFAEIDERFDTGFDPGTSLVPDLGDFRPPHGAVLVATLRGEPVGCGALKLHDSDAPTPAHRWAEIKRMWVAPETRGLGLGRRLLTELEAYAVAAGARSVRLETNRTLAEAIAMYRSSGYVEVEPYNDEPYADHWFEKTLAVERS